MRAQQGWHRAIAKQKMRIGVISDTHGHFDSKLRESLAGAAMILHAGDVGSQDVLDELGQIAPIRAVRGNVDAAELDLPLSLKLACDGFQVEMMHILPAMQSEVQQWAELAAAKGAPPSRSERFLRSFAGSTRVVIFGHSHQPCLTPLGQRLFFNPGSAGRRRFSLPRCCGLLELVPGRITASIELLEKYNGVLPARIQLAFEE